MTVTVKDLLLIQEFLHEVFEALPENDIRRISIVIVQTLVLDMALNHKATKGDMDSATMN